MEIIEYYKNIRGINNVDFNSGETSNLPKQIKVMKCLDSKVSLTIIPIMNIQADHGKRLYRNNLCWS